VGTCEEELARIEDVCLEERSALVAKCRDEIEALFKKRRDMEMEILYATQVELLDVPPFLSQVLTPFVPHPRFSFSVNTSLAFPCLDCRTFSSQTTGYGI
jgi:hypothetical protein